MHGQKELETWKTENERHAEAKNRGSNGRKSPPPWQASSISELPVVFPPVQHNRAGVVSTESSTGGAGH